MKVYEFRKGQCVETRVKVVNKEMTARSEHQHQQDPQLPKLTKFSSTWVSNIHFGCSVDARACLEMSAINITCSKYIVRHSI